MASVLSSVLNSSAGQPVNQAAPLTNNNQPVTQTAQSGKQKGVIDGRGKEKEKVKRKVTAKKPRAKTDVVNAWY